MKILNWNNKLKNNTYTKGQMMKKKLKEKKTQVFACMVKLKRKITQ